MHDVCLVKGSTHLSLFAQLFVLMAIEPRRTLVQIRLSRSLNSNYSERGVSTCKNK